MKVAFKREGKTLRNLKWFRAPRHRHRHALLAEKIVKLSRYL